MLKQCLVLFVVCVLAGLFFTGRLSDAPTLLLSIVAMVGLPYTLLRWLANVFNTNNP